MPGDTVPQFGVPPSQKPIWHLGSNVATLQGRQRRCFFGALASNLVSLVLLWNQGAALAATFTYGQHLPHGLAAVQHIYSSTGTWKNIQKPAGTSGIPTSRPLEYIWNYYDKCATRKHVADRNSLIAAADGTRFFTTRDAGCLLLGDFNQNREIDSSEVSPGFAFHEHNGLGIGGQQKGPPFTQFWFDDNWVARFMSQAYSKPSPSGLYKTSKFIRWNILSGSTSNWRPYSNPGSYQDLLALNGMFYLACSPPKVKSATSTWEKLLAMSNAAYNGSMQRYDYPGIRDNYKLGLYLIMGTFLMDALSARGENVSSLVQHWVSLRSAILSRQESNGTSLLGWITDAFNPISLINTETLSANVLGLGASAHFTFEAGRPPLSSSNNSYFLREHNVLSAVVGLSSAGFMVQGPCMNYPVGAYLVEFWLRAPQPSSVVADLVAYDATNARAVATKQVNSTGMEEGNVWTRVALRFTLSVSNNSMEFRVWWHGTCNMDVAVVRLRRKT